MMLHSTRKLLPAWSSSSSQLHEPQNSNRQPKRFSFGSLSSFDLSRNRTTTSKAATSISTSSHTKANEIQSSDPASNAVDHLPDDQVKLDGIVNYHLSQLDRLKLELACHNETIELLSYTNPPEGMECVAMKLLERIQGAKDARNLLAHFMTFHVHEVLKILKLKQKISGTADYPAILRNLPTIQDLHSMFCDDESNT